MPTLVDDGEAIWDSQAIMTYLVGKYAEEDSLYPADLLTRARIDQRLHFNSGVLFPRLVAAFRAQLCGDADIASKLEPISAAFNFLEVFLADSPYLVGDSMTLADIAAITTVASSQAFVPLDPELHGKILAWMDLLSTQLPTYDEYVTQVGEKFREKLSGTQEKQESDETDAE